MCCSFCHRCMWRRALLEGRMGSYRWRSCSCSAMLLSVGSGGGECSLFSVLLLAPMPSMGSAKPSSPFASSSVGDDALKRVQHITEVCTCSFARCTRSVTGVHRC